MSAGTSTKGCRIKLFLEDLSAEFSPPAERTNLLIPSHVLTELTLSANLEILLAYCSSPFLLINSILWILPRRHVRPAECCGSALIQSAVPETCKNTDDGEGVVLGIDEAGRGPVLGPMIYGAAYWSCADDKAVSAMGFDDSKALTPSQREGLFERIDNVSLVLPSNPMPCQLRGDTIMPCIRALSLFAVTVVNIQVFWDTFNVLRLTCDCNSEFIVCDDRFSSILGGFEASCGVIHPRPLVFG